MIQCKCRQQKKYFKKLFLLYDAPSEARSRPWPVSQGVRGQEAEARAREAQTRKVNCLKGQGHDIKMGSKWYG